MKLCARTELIYSRVAAGRRVASGVRVDICVSELSSSKYSSTKFSTRVLLVSYRANVPATKSPPVSKTAGRA